jgi:hypothetical protein
VRPMTSSCAGVDLRIRSAEPMFDDYHELIQDFPIH